ncbi:MAG: hypothetical protein GY849_20630, partial [Deltaproteobacteria bacterium]|nr:hypothetical protein [Deltaproteobacteria bacterium]
DIATTSTPQFARLGLGAAAHGTAPLNVSGDAYIAGALHSVTDVNVVDSGTLDFQDSAAASILSLDEATRTATIYNLNVNGTQTVIDTTTTQADHLTLDPGAAGTTAVDINPASGITLTGNILTAKKTNNGSNVLTVDKDGDIAIVSAATTANTFDVTGGALTSGHLIKGVMNEDATTGNLIYITDDNGTPNDLFVLDNSGNIDTVGSISATGAISTDSTLSVGTTTTLNSIAYTWPGSESADYVLTTNGSGTLTWTDVTAGPGAGDITDVGDATSGAVFTADGTGNNLYFEGSTADTYEVILTGAEATGSDKTITLPNAAGTVAVSATTPITLSAAGDIGIGASSTSADGYLSQTDWDTFNDKMGTTLTAANVLVGNASNVATGVAMTGD